MTPVTRDVGTSRRQRGRSRVITRRGGPLSVTLNPVEYANVQVRTIRNLSQANGLQVNAPVEAQPVEPPDPVPIPPRCGRSSTRRSSRGRPPVANVSDRFAPGPQPQRSRPSGPRGRPRRGAGRVGGNVGGRDTLW